MNIFKTIKVLNALKQIDFNNNSNNINVSDNVSIITKDYIHLINFTLKKMKVSSFDKIDFSKNEFGNISSFLVVNEKIIEIDFDLFIRHNDFEETEIRCEIDNLLNEFNIDEVLKKLKEYDFRI